MSPKNKPNRRELLGLVAVVAVGGIGALPHFLSAAPRTQVSVWKTPNCGCCKAWVKDLESNGFAVVVHDVSDTASKRQSLGLPEKYAACHTGLVNGYVLEGHVPAREIQKMLRDKPVAVGLAVPGMPAGSPGMEMDTTADAFDVVLVLKDGSARVFASYPAKAA